MFKCEIATMQEVLAAPEAHSEATVAEAALQLPKHLRCCRA